MTEAVGYLRVSGKGQLAGDGFDRQREAIERYAAAEGYTIVAWFEERGLTGKTEWDDRDAWVEMVATQPTVIIVENMSRLSREFAVQEIFWRQLRKLNIRLLSAQEPDLEDDTADPTRKLIRGIIGLLHEYDRSQIEAKLRSARTRIRTREGRCEGRKPYGTRPGEADILAYMLRRKEEGLTVREIARALTMNGMATRTGKPWHRSTVAKILTAQRGELDARARKSANLPAAADVPQHALFAPEWPSDPIPESLPGLSSSRP